MPEPSYFCLFALAVLRRIYRLLRNTLLILISLFLLFSLALYLPSFQNLVVRQITQWGSKQWGTAFEIQRIHIGWFNRLRLEGLYLEDQQGDTLIYAGRLQVRVSDILQFGSGKAQIRYAGLEQAKARISREKGSDQWNFQFLLDAFSSSGTEPGSGSRTIEFQLRDIEFKDLDFRMRDAWKGENLDLSLGSFRLDARGLDWTKKIIDIRLLEAKGLSYIARSYEGGAPLPPATALPLPLTHSPADTSWTPFNPDGWQIRLGKIEIQESHFQMEANEGPGRKGEFDPEHLIVRSINLLARDLELRDDTLSGHIENLSAKERGGLEIRHLSTRFRLSPNATLCEDLRLETPRSRLENYYAMHYGRFADFQRYVDKVLMDIRLKNSHLDLRDLAYFVPALQGKESVIRAKGEVRGRVGELRGKGLVITDGYGGITGDMEIRGLPDMQNTWIHYQGTIMGSGPRVLHYVPQWQDHPSLALEKLTHFHFEGQLRGSLAAFETHARIQTNMGALGLDLNYWDKGRGEPRYEGNLVISRFELGTLFRNAQWGIIDGRASLQGQALNPQTAQVQLKAHFQELGFHGYAYQNLSADGVLEQNRFTGLAIVNDPNLALSFNGSLDFRNRDSVEIIAQAHLLHGDFQALQFSELPMSGSADFDLNLMGSSLEQFQGYARLYNINLRRENHRLDLDSVYAVSTQEPGGKREIRVESNALSAHLQGDFHLSTLGNSVQYYLSGYLPNYIPQPEGEAPRQDLRFSLTTRAVDSLLAVIRPSIRGFSHSEIQGSLNTESQRLSFQARIPYGAVNAMSIENTRIFTEGDFQILGIHAEAELAQMGSLAGNLSLTTTLGNDSMRFSIATYPSGEEKGAYGTATINGMAFARADSLHFRLSPSEFYLDQKRWLIPDGSQVVYAGQYLWVDQFHLRSGHQHLSIQSDSTDSRAALRLKIESLELNSFKRFLPTEDMEWQGILNGEVAVHHLFDSLRVGARIQAQSVAIGKDTLGDVRLFGRYNRKSNRLEIQEKSGIFRGNQSITCFGDLVFLDSQSTQKLDGKLVFSQAPISWASPFLRGFVSELGGVLNGTISLKGSGSRPDVQGLVRLDDARMRLDFLGTRYEIHHANIEINNQEINLGNIKLFDQFKNPADLSGRISHNRFKNLRLNIQAKSPRFEVVNLKASDGQAFYGNLVAGFQSLSVSGPMDDISVRISSATPVEKSHLYIPIVTGTGAGSYHYVHFKSPDSLQTEPELVKRSKLRISINALLNPLAEVTLVLDPSTGDAIHAVGTGNMNLEIPSDDDIRLYGLFDIEKGSYVFTLKQLLFRRTFQLNPGSRISFNGPISQTELNVEGTYTTQTRLYDLLDMTERAALQSDSREESETMAPQDVNILLSMRGSLEEPDLHFKIDLPDKRMVGSIAYTKLMRINLDETQLFNQVASLLLINSFISPVNDIGGGARAGVLSNAGEILSATASSQLTNIVSRITGDQNLSLGLRYKQYSYTEMGPDQSMAGSRNEISLDLRKNFLNDRLSIEVGNAYDWGRPSAEGNKNYFNPAGDFRIQYQFREGGNLRGYIFRTSNFDAINNDNLSRGGMGISWKRQFDNLEEFFFGTRYARKQVEEQRRQRKSEDQQEESKSIPPGSTP